MANRSQRRKWMAAVRKSDLPPETKAVAYELAKYAGEDGRITDPDIVAMLRELDWEAGQS